MHVVFSNWVKCGSEEEARESFGDYFRQHYRPLLDRIADCTDKKIVLSDNDRSLLRFLRDDLGKIFVFD